MSLPVEMVTVSLLIVNVIEGWTVEMVQMNRTVVSVINRIVVSVINRTVVSVVISRYLNRYPWNTEIFK
jgi:hypothetical protein